MNDGESKTPEQAVRPRWVVRLVSFGAAVLVAALVLVGIASLRYGAWLPESLEGEAVVSEMALPPPPPAPPPSNQPPPQTPPVLPAREPPVSDPPSAPNTPAAEQSEPQIITTASWVSRPRNPERFYPREAFMQGVSGQVVLDCLVETSGRMQCSIVSETPEGRGFGDAALRIASEHVMRPAMANGAPVRGRYRMTIPFSTGD